MQPGCILIYIIELNNFSIILFLDYSNAIFFRSNHKYWPLRAQSKLCSFLVRTGNCFFDSLNDFINNSLFFFLLSLVCLNNYILDIRWHLNILSKFH